MTRRFKIFTTMFKKFLDHFCCGGHHIVVESEGSFSRVGVVGESRRDLGEREEEVEREEGEKGKEWRKERVGGRRALVQPGEEEGSW